ncbi:MAG: hypothetical protein J6V90_07120 [Treponema sp.]|nr:hypothetical protein [Treponema sp.]
MDSLKLKSFDIGEMGGGEQIIIDSRTISETEHYVITLGNAPKINIPPNSNIKELEKRYLESKKNENVVKTKERDNIKLRFFKLTRKEGKKYLIEEYVTPESVSAVAKLFI